MTPSPSLAAAAAAAAARRRRRAPRGGTASSDGAAEAGGRPGAELRRPEEGLQPPTRPVFSAGPPGLRAKQR